jgi:hypothetical protein
MKPQMTAQVHPAYGKPSDKLSIAADNGPNPWGWQTAKQTSGLKIYLIIYQSSPRRWIEYIFNIGEISSVYIVFPFFNGIVSSHTNNAAAH